MRPLHRNGRNAVEDDGQTAFLPREEWAVRPGEESWCRRRCSKGSSGEAIPCQPRPLMRRHWARVTLDREKWHFPDFQDRTAMRKVSSPGVLPSRHCNRRYRQRPCANPGLIEISAIGPPLASPKPTADSRPRSDPANSQTNLTQDEERRNCHLKATPCLVPAELTLRVPPRSCRAGLGKMAKLGTRAAPLCPRCSRDYRSAEQ